MDEQTEENCRPRFLSSCCRGELKNKSLSTILQIDQRIYICCVVIPVVFRQSHIRYYDVTHTRANISAYVTSHGPTDFWVFLRRIFIIRHTNRKTRGPPPRQLSRVPREARAAPRPSFRGHRLLCASVSVACRTRRSLIRRRRVRTAKSGRVRTGRVPIRTRNCRFRLFRTNVNYSFNNVRCTRSGRGTGGWNWCRPSGRTSFSASVFSRLNVHHSTSECWRTPIINVTLCTSQIRCCNV